MGLLATLLRQNLIMQFPEIDIEKADIQKQAMDLAKKMYKQTPCYLCRPWL